MKALHAPEEGPIMHRRYQKMRRILTIFVVTAALVATLASSALANTTFPCIIGCYGTWSVTDVELR